ncbi:MAG: DUF1476 domain-containing protein [Alphaproteobacteria bacterium]|nr:DUF1476 domain-containing protein [Alphaproteobacteria bacterium]
MSGFDEREKAFENKFKQDQELQFKVLARRNKLLGLWAAAKKGISGAAAEAYAKEVVAADFEKPGHEDVVEKLVKDLAARGVAVTADEVRREAERLLPEAKRQIMAA